MPSFAKGVIAVVLGWILLCGLARTQNVQSIVDANQSAVNQQVPLRLESGNSQQPDHLIADKRKATNANKPPQSAAMNSELERANLMAAQRSADAAERQAKLALPALIVSGISVILVLGALYLAFVSNGIARKSARDELRAYVLPKEIFWQHRGIGGVKHIELRAVFKNSGKTPTKYLKMGMASYMTEAGEAPPQVRLELSEDSQIFPLGSDATVLTNAIFVTSEQMEEVWSDKKNLYIMGVATYRDLFSTMERQTRFNYRITMGKDAEGNFNWCEWTHVGLHNCMDGECSRLVAWEKKNVPKRATADINSSQEGQR